MSEATSGNPRGARAARWRRWGWVAVVALGMYWPAAYVFLNTSLGEWVVNGGWSSRPRKVRMHWTSGTSWWPGRFELRGVDLHGESRRMDWSLTAEQAQGRIAFIQLFRRRVLLREVTGQGAVFALSRRAEELASATPRARRWTVELPEIALDDVDELRFGTWKLTGDGQARGGFRWAAGQVSLEGGAFTMSSARFASEGRELVREVELEASAELSPYVPRDHPGALGFNFLAGTLSARGLGGAAADDVFTTSLAVAQGRLLPGSRLGYRATQGESKLVYEGSVAEQGGAALLRLAIDATHLVVGPRPGAPPLLTSRELRLTAESRDTGLASLFGRARELQAGSEATPFEGELVAHDLRLHLVGEKLAGQLTVDHTTGRLDVGAFLHRELAITGLRAEGGIARIDTLAPGAGLPPRPNPWALRFPDARLSGLREVRYDAFSLSGPAHLVTSFAFAPDGMLAVEELSLSLPQGTLLESEAPLARGVKLEVAARLEPLAAHELAAATLLSGLSGTATTKAQVSSLGFLRQWLGRVAWLALAGQGRLSADLRVDHGRLLAGSRLEVLATAIEAQILGSVARGQGRIEAEVKGEAEAARLGLLARLDRFAVDDEVRSRLLEGTGLEIRVSSAEAVRLGVPPADLRAIVKLERAILPNFAMFNPLLPGGADVELLPAVGSLGLYLELDGKAQTGHGKLSLDADQAQVRLQELVIGGRLHVDAPLTTTSFTARRFNLAGTHLTLDPASYHEMGDSPGEPAHGWWARMELPEAELVMGRPVHFESSLELEMKDTGPFLALFAQKRRYLNWFSQVLLVEGVHARAMLRLGKEGLTVDPLRVEAEKLAAVARMRFGEGAKQGDFFLSYGKLEVGVELRDGKRDLKILNPRKWFETWHPPL